MRGSSCSYRVRARQTAKPFAPRAQSAAALGRQHAGSRKLSVRVEPPRKRRTRRRAEQRRSHCRVEAVGFHGFVGSAPRTHKTRLAAKQRKRLLVFRVIPQAPAAAALKKVSSGKPFARAHLHSTGG